MSWIDTFTRSNQSNWGTASDGETWALATAADATLSISSNEGLVANGSNMNIMLLGTKLANDAEGLVRVKCNTADNAPGVVLRCASNAATFYLCNLSGGNINFFASGSFLTSASFTMSNNTYYWIRFRVKGTSLYGRAWQDGNSEPSTWNITTTDSSVTSGRVGLHVYGNSGITAYFDHFSVYQFRIIPATVALLQTSKRTIPATAALLQTKTRTIPATAALSQPKTRTIPATAVLLQTKSRTIPASVALLQTRTRTIPGTVALLLKKSRTIPSTAALLLTSNRTIPASTALLQTKNRTVPATAVLSLGPHIYTISDLSYQKFQMVKVYDASGNFIDVIRDAPYLSGYKENINAAADTVRLIIPRPIDAFDGQYQAGTKNTIVQGNNIQWWLYGAGLPASGMLRYSGKIDTITPKIDDSGGETIEIVVTPYSQILGDHAVTSTVTFGTAGNSSTYIDTGQMLQSFFTGSYVDSTGTTQTVIDSITGQAYMYPYTLDPTSIGHTGQKTQFPFQSQNMLSVVSNILLLSPANYYIRMNQDQTSYFGQIATLPKYTLRLGQHISNIEFPQDNVPRKNVAVLQGKGVQGKYTGSSVSSLGQRVYFKSDNRITDSATAQALANGLGAVYDQTIIRAKIKIPDYRGDQQPGLGYDIEQFKVGETLKIVDQRAPTSSITGKGSVWGSSVWGRDKWGAATPQPSIWGSSVWGSGIWGSSIGAIFNQIVAIQSIQYDFFSVTLEVGFKSPTLNRKIYDIESKFSDATMVQ